MGKVKFFDSQGALRVIKGIIKDGDTIAVPTFYHVGVAYMFLKALANIGTKDLNIISNDPGLPGLGTGLLIRNGQVRSLTTSFIGTNPEAMEKYIKGELRVEMFPQGTLLRKLRDGGDAGSKKNIGGFLTRTGVGTKFSEGKTLITIGGIDYLLETPLRARVGLIKAWIADKKGNLIYSKAARNFNPVAIKACDISIVEADYVVENIGKPPRGLRKYFDKRGEYLDPNIIVTPSCYVDIVVKTDNSWKKDLKVSRDRVQADVNPKRIRIAKRAAKELKDGDVVNLGIGTPTMVANFIPEDISVDLQSENGILGMGSFSAEGEEDNELINAGRQPVTLKSGGAFFDSLEAFSMITGGRVDKTVLGAFEISETGDLANYMIPGKRVPGVGGGMDLAMGAKQVIVATEHLSGEGGPRIVRKCSLPLTGKGVVDLIITDLAVIEVVPRGLVLKEIASDTTIDEVIAKTDAPLIIDEEIGIME